jgi:hypothetical protein
MTSQLFSKFTNQYELSKTLRFELKAIAETQRLLEENNVFKKDEIIQNKYTKTKVYFDQLHQEFVADSLQNLEFSDLEKYEEILNNYKKDKNNKTFKKELEAQEKRLRKEVVECFNATAKVWIKNAKEKYNIEFKKSDYKFLFEIQGGNIFELLKNLYREKSDAFLKDKETKDYILDENGEKISLFDDWGNFGGYFDKFFETRKNFYKDDGTSSAIATRIVDNLQRFVENKWQIEKYPDEVLESISIEDLEELKNLKYYTNFVLQGERQNKEKGIKPTKIEKYNVLVGKIKSAINAFRQNPENKDENGRSPKLPYLKTFDKQILSEKNIFMEEISDEKELKIKLQKFLETGNNKIAILEKLFSDFVQNLEKYNLEEIYFTKKGFETVSRKYSQDTFEWQEKLGEVLNLKKQKDKGYKFPDFIKLTDLKKSLENFLEDENFEARTFWKEQYIGKKEKNNSAKIDVNKTIWENFLEIFYLEFQENLEKKVNTDKGEEIQGYKKSSAKIQEILENAKNSEQLKITSEFKKDVKEFADDLLEIYQFAKYFSVEKKNIWNKEKLELDDEFYHHSDYGYYENFFQDSYETIVQPYNLIRNFLTKKPWESVQKWKLNFENSTLAYGWDKNKETDNTAIILRQGGKYYLAIMKKNHNHLFADKNKEKFSGTGYKKMVYKFFPDQAKMFPKVCFSQKGLEFFNPSEEIYRIYKNAEFKKGETFSLESMWKLIDFYKLALTQYDGWKCYDFKHLKSTQEYKDNIGEFFTDVAKDGYKISWENISENYITEKNKFGELYLFQIKNKDWNDGATGTKNMHTFYFENLFSEENALQNFVMKMNGQAEIFYRPKAIEEKEVERNFKRKIIEKKRYTQDKIFFHLPMTLNRGAGQPRNFAFNETVNKFLAENAKQVNILGIDRGEKHLAYYSVITPQGKILDSGSLNNPTGKKDYHLELEQRAEKRKKERQDWQEVSDIKNLKSGYISQVVHKIATLAIEHNAIIVFEDLNMRFKQIRGGIEKSAYQQLEKALIDKFNFLADKQKNPDAFGGVLKAYQLAAPVEAFKDMGKQTGMIFYTTASYTSKIDPKTGWRPNVYFKKGSAKVNKDNILKFDKIFWNTEKNRFEITYDLKKLIQSKNVKYPSKTVWTVCSSVDRFRWNRHLNNNKGGYDEYRDNSENSITENLKNLFKKYDIEISGNILDQIENLETKGNEKFFSEFLFFFQLICQIRNTDEKVKDIDKQDFILSPVEPFFDSRKPEEFENLPKNGDDNGAYNIARKGIITLERIKKFYELSKEEQEKKKFPELFVNNQEWDEFVVNKHV